VIVLTLLLIAALGGVGLKIYRAWEDGSWSLPEQSKPKPHLDRDTMKAPVAARPPMLGTDAIIAKNLFDPERGAGVAKATEADTRAVQRIRNMVLLGTAILDSTRYAVVQDGDGVARATGTAQPPGPPMVRRIKVGDSIEGFNLTEVGERAVVFVRGPTRVELSIDYLRKVPVAAAPAPSQPGPSRSPNPATPAPAPNQPDPAAAPDQPAPGSTPGVIPNLPRRPRLPAPAGR